MEVIVRTSQDCQNVWELDLGFFFFNLDMQTFWGTTGEGEGLGEILVCFTNH